MSSSSSAAYLIGHLPITRMSWNSSLTDLEGGKDSELVLPNYVTKEVDSKDIDFQMFIGFVYWLVKALRWCDRRVLWFSKALSGISSG
jgi:hypothetical protein